MYQNINPSVCEKPHQAVNKKAPNRLLWLIVLGFNDTSTLVGHFVSSPREREKRDRRDSRGDEREGQGRKRNRNESEETEEVGHAPSTLTCYKDSRPCLTISQFQLDAPLTYDTRHLRHTRPPPPTRLRGCSLCFIENTLFDAKRCRPWSDGLHC